MKLKNIKNIKSRTRQLGFTLIELMISLALGAIVISGLISVYVATVVSSYDTIAMSKLSQQTSALVNIMTSDIRRAGYWGNASIDFDRSPAINPFSEFDKTALSVRKSVTDDGLITGNIATEGQCILYTYDVNDDGVLGDVDIVGFRLNGTVVEMRVKGKALNANQVSCNDNDDEWGEVTDRDVISVDSLTFSLVNSVCINTREPNDIDDDGKAGTSDTDEMDCYTIKPDLLSGDITTETLQITINITASLVSDSDVKMNMSQVVRVRNDRVREW